MEILVFLMATLLGVAINFITNETGGSTAFRIVRNWSVPLMGLTIILILVGQVALRFIDQPVQPKTIWTSRRSPFPGLLAFEEADSSAFFGRNRESSDLFDRLHPATRTAPAAERIITVVGPSGVGKTSLVQAGLVARLRPGSWITVPPFVPARRPLRNLAEALGIGIPESAADEIEEKLRNGRIAEILANLRLSGRGRRRPILLVVDQAEELFTQAGPDEAGLLLGLLPEIVAADDRIWILLVLRADFISTALKSGYAGMLRSIVAVGALDAQQLNEVIERSAALVGMRFDPPSLIARIVADTGSGEALPLLGYVMQALFLRVGANGVVQNGHYDEIGGIEGALARRADQVMDELVAQDPARPVLQTLLKLVAVSGDEPTRARVPLGQFGSAERVVVDAFVGARLLVTDGDEESSTVSASHEALFRYWPPLRQAIEAGIDDLRWFTDLQRLATDWDRSGRLPSYLLSAERLVAAEHWCADHAESLVRLSLVTEFVRQSRWADRAARRRLAESLAHRALAEVGRDPEHALALAVASVGECEATPAGRRALAATLNVSRQDCVLSGPGDALWGIAWSPDGTKVAATSHDGTVQVYAPGERSRTAVLHGHEDWVRGVCWSPDGTRLVSASRDGTVRVLAVGDGPGEGRMEVLHRVGSSLFGLDWSSRGLIAVAAENGNVYVLDPAAPVGAVVRTVLTGHEGPVYGVAWSPEGKRLVSASHDRTARVWSLASGDVEAVLAGHADTVWSAAFSPQGDRVATASYDRKVRVFGYPKCELVAEFEGHSDWIRPLAWSPDGTQVATGGYDRTVRVWDVARRTQAGVLRGHSGAVWGIAWAPAGDRIASVGQDRVVRVWATRDPTERLVMRTHSDALWGVGWWGDRIATTSFDCTARIFDAEDGGELHVLRGHSHTVCGLRWSYDGRLATGSHDGNVCVWDTDGRLAITLRGHTDTVWGVAWSPDDRYVVTSAYDRTVRVWDPVTGEQLSTRDTSHVICAVDWSPSGDLIAAASFDHSVHLWDPFDLGESEPLTGHDGTVWDVRWSPDGLRVATASQDQTVRVHRPGDDAVSLVLTGHDDTVWSVAWSPDGRRLATASQDGTARIFDAETGAELLVLGMHGGSVRSVTWSPDGRRLATASADHTARVWDATTDLETLLRRGRSRMTKHLSEDERRSMGMPPGRGDAHGR